MNVYRIYQNYCSRYLITIDIEMKTVKTEKFLIREPFVNLNSNFSYSKKSSFMDWQKFQMLLTIVISMKIEFACKNVAKRNWKKLHTLGYGTYTSTTKRKFVSLTSNPIAIEKHITTFLNWHFEFIKKIIGNGTIGSFDPYKYFVSKYGNISLTERKKEKLLWLYAIDDSYESNSEEILDREKEKEEEICNGTNELVKYFNLKMRYAVEATKRVCFSSMWSSRFLWELLQFYSVFSSGTEMCCL